jgi:hypothetical protein
MANFERAETLGTLPQTLEDPMANLNPLFGTAFGLLTGRNIGLGQSPIVSGQGYALSNQPIDRHPADPHLGRDQLLYALSNILNFSPAIRAMQPYNPSPESIPLLRPERAYQSGLTPPSRNPLNILETIANTITPATISQENLKAQVQRNLKTQIANEKTALKVRTKGAAMQTYLRYLSDHGYADPTTAPVATRQAAIRYVHSQLK